MSHSHPLSLVTPQVVPPLNLTSHLTNYLLLRSFQLNFSKDTLTHIPVYRPAFNNTLVAGDHHFEFRVPGIPYPVISVTFYCSPNITIPIPLTTVLFIQTMHGDHGLMPQLIIHGEVKEPLPSSYRVLLMDGIDDLPILQTLTKKATEYQLPVDLTVQITR
jgi:hypothetical protein